MFFYKIIPKEYRSISSLENYNKYIKETLNAKKFVEWINILPFLNQKKKE